MLFSESVPVRSGPFRSVSARSGLFRSGPVNRDTEIIPPCLTPCSSTNDFEGLPHQLTSMGRVCHGPSLFWAELSSFSLNSVRCGF